MEVNRTETDDEIRLNGLASFSSQNRAVTRDDYVIRAYSMPAKFGSIAKAYVSKDGILDSKSQLNVIKNTFEDEVKVNPSGLNVVYGELNNPLAINMYVLSYDNNKRLTEPNEVVLKNLKTYMSKYRMLTDGLNITNAFIINFGINFEISVFHNYNKKQVLLECIDSVGRMFDIDKISIAQPIELGEIELTLSTISGVKSVISVEAVNLTVDDGDYSENEYDIKSAMVGKTIYPSMDPSIFELKFPKRYKWEGGIMITFLYSEKSCTLYRHYKYKNTGSDEILELENDFSKNGQHLLTRILIKFNLNSIDANVLENAKYFLNLKVTQKTELENNSKVEVFPIKGSWEEG